MRLVIYSDVLSRLLIDLEYYDGKTHVNYIKDSLINDTNKWLSYGLHEWIDVEIPGFGPSKEPRTTLSTDPEFLPRLKSYLQKTYSFQFILGERFMIELERKFGDRDWFHSIGTDPYGRVVVYINYACQETLYSIPDKVDGKQVLVHFAASKLAKREDFCNMPSNSRQQSADVDILNRDINTLIGEFGREKVRDIFYEIHDKQNALTNLSPKHPYARDILEKLYDEYGFDVLFDLLDNED